MNQPILPGRDHRTMPHSASVTWTFDRSAVLEQLDNDDELLADVVAQFLDDAPAALAAIHAAVQAGDGEARAEAAHALKGAAGYLGADVLCRAAARLETLGRAGRTDEAVDAHREFTRIARHVIEQIRLATARCA